MLFDYYVGVKVESSNLWVDMMCSIVEFKIRVLEELLRVLSPNRIFVTAASLDSKMLQLILLILFRRVNLLFV